jgi:hypothetical protein
MIIEPGERSRSVERVARLMQPAAGEFKAQRKIHAVPEI